jgi:plasmid stabilization system protein ParE
VSFTIRLSELAISDLLAIRDWISGEADDEIAQSFIDRIRVKIETLNTFPERGEAVPTIRPGSRKLSFERNYVILYRIDDRSVLIDRIVSGRRNLEALG